MKKTEDLSQSKREQLDTGPGSTGEKSSESVHPVLDRASAFCKTDLSPTKLHMLGSPVWPRSACYTVSFQVLPCLLYLCLLGRMGAFGYLSYTEIVALKNSAQFLKISPSSQ